MPRKEKNIISAGTQKNIQIPKMEKKTSVMWRLGRRHAEKKKSLRSNSLFAVSINTDERRFFSIQSQPSPQPISLGCFLGGDPTTWGTPLCGVPWGGAAAAAGQDRTGPFFQKQKCIVVVMQKKVFLAEINETHTLFNRKTFLNNRAEFLNNRAEFLNNLRRNLYSFYRDFE